MKVCKIASFVYFCIMAMFLTNCTNTDAIPEYDSDVPIAFNTRIGNVGSTRAGGPGPMDNTTLQSTGFGVFAQHTGNTGWNDYGKGASFNFMWNQQVDWSTDHWTYQPVKYWPNDNQPADDQDPPAQGSQERSYVSFFAYAPYVDAATLPTTTEAKAAADGIVEITGNSTAINNSYIYYRTDLGKPFDVNESVDLLWATQQDRFKMDGGGFTTGHVDFVFKHALAKVSIMVKTLIDRTSTYKSEAYSDELDANSRVFIDNVTISTPPFYSEGKLMIAPNQSTIKWDYTGVADEKKYTGWVYSTSESGKFSDNVKYALRYAAPNVPTDQADAETAKTDFDAMKAGVTHEEQPLSANYDNGMYMFLPTEDTQDITVKAVYHVITYDPKLTLNSPKFYSIVENDITATMNNSAFKFEPNKQYKIVLNLGLTSVKFEVYELDDFGEWILLSAVVKDWDTETKEVNVE